MTTLLISLLAVGVLLLIAVPGYLLVKRNMVSVECIPGFSKVLLFVCQPCLAIYSFMELDFTLGTLANLGIFALLIILIHAIMLGGSYLVLRKRCTEPIYRIITIGTTFGNCAFFGIPVIEALMPEVAAEVIVYTTVYAVVMNVLGWTVGSAIISRDAKYISLKKVFLNPAMIGAFAALLIFVLGIDFGNQLGSMISLTGKMATPLSMIIMGMRLGTMKLSGLFTNVKVWSAIAVKQFVMPLVAFLVAVCLPADPYLERTFFVICACPVASIVLNYAELVGCGQEEGANSVLLGTMASILTLPITALLLNFL